MSHDNEELIDYEDENDVVTNGAGASAAATRADDKDDKEKKIFSGTHSTGFTLHGVRHYLVKLEESEKIGKLNELLDALEFKQV